MNIPSRGSEEERIRIPCRYGLIYRMTDIINKTELGKYVSVHVRYRVVWHASAALAEGRSETMVGQERKVSGRRKQRQTGFPLQSPRLYTCSGYSHVSDWPVSR